MTLYRIGYRKKVRFGKNVTFRKCFSLAPMNDGIINIGDNVFFNHYCSVYALNKIEIGDGTIFGENVKIYDHNHVYADKQIPIKHQGYVSAPISIGKHCWIGSNVTILKGVTIGDNCVIGAGCVIYKDVSSNSIVINRQNLQYKTMNLK